MMLGTSVLSWVFSFTFAGLGTYSGYRLANATRRKEQKEKAYELDEVWSHAYDAAGNELRDLIAKVAWRLGKSTNADGQQGMRWNLWVEGTLLGSLVVTHVKVCDHGLLTPVYWRAIRPDGTAEERCYGAGEAVLKLLEVSPWPDTVTS